MRAKYLRSIVTLVLGAFFLTSAAYAANEPADKALKEKITSLINPKGTVHIQGLGIETAEKGQLRLEIHADLGLCWGEKELAKTFARDALKALFASDLLIENIIISVYEKEKLLLTVALGKNQAKKLDWSQNEPLDSFYTQIKSRIHYKGSPADVCLIIEKEPGLSE